MVSQLTQKVLLGVLQLEVLVREFVAVDALAASAVALGEVTALDHELLDHTVERRALVAKALLASGEGTEVLSRLGNGLAVQTHDDAAQRLIAVGDVEVDLVGDLGALGGLGGRREEDHADSDEQQSADGEPAQVEHDGLFVTEMHNWPARVSSR